MSDQKVAPDLHKVSSLPGNLRPSDWMASYRTRIVVTDILIIGFSVAAPLVLLKMWDIQHARLNFLIVASLLWVISLAAFDSRSARTLGSGMNEYKTVIDATFVSLGGVAVVAFLFGTTVNRHDVFPSVPLGLFLLLVGRWGWRQWLRRQRADGRFLNRAVLVGSASTVAHTEEQLHRHPDSGYTVVGTVVASESSLGGAELYNEVVDTLARNGGDTVMLTSSDALTPKRIRTLAWDLERHDHRLVITPSLTDVAESRIQTQPVAGLPLIHILAPNYSGPQRVVKRFFDVCGAGLILLVLSPVMLAVALAVRATSPGPVFYRQERIGRGEHPFAILKFRSMQVDADSRLAGLLAEQGTAQTPLFKIEKDPRLTRVGPFLRRFSLDELPQLINVLKGNMSLVGPRPQIQAEVDLYDDAAQRRLKVRPGMTGLWQVSGRSRLTWEEALRLDLYYIENWSLVVDLVIMWRTFRAVVGSDGAY